MEIVFTLKEVHSIPFLKTQDSLGLFSMCLLSVGPEVQRNFLYHRRHTHRMDAAGRWQGSQEGSHGDGDELQSTCALHRGQPLPGLADAGQVRKSTQGVGPDPRIEPRYPTLLADALLSEPSGKPSFLETSSMLIGKYLLLPTPFCWKFPLDPRMALITQDPKC